MTPNVLRRLAGLVIAALILLALLHGLAPGFPRWPAGLAAWLAGALLIARLPSGQTLQVAVLIGIGLIALIWALSLGAQPAWLRLLDTNAGLIAMIASVSFLRLVAVPGEDSATRLPVGSRAWRKTLLSVAVFGSFINISAPILIADRLAVDGRLSRFTSQSITRVFSGCSAYSPFFGGMAMILTYVPQTSLPFVMMAGLPFALAGIGLVMIEATLRYREHLQTFRGYPLTVSGLWVPAVLAVAVSVAFLMMPQASVLVIIALSALTVSVVVLIGRFGIRPAARRLQAHVVDGLPGMVGELLLFLAAGVLATGLGELASAGHVTMPMSQFNATAASLMLAVMLLLSAAGLHPVISIAAVTPLLTPIDPDPQLLAVTCLLCWSLGTCASPLSGTHLIFQGRYGVPSFRAAVWNWPYAALMYGVAVAVLVVVARIRGIA